MTDTGKNPTTELEFKYEMFWTVANALPCSPVAWIVPYLDKSVCRMSKCKNTYDRLCVTLQRSMYMHPHQIKPRLIIPFGFVSSKKQWQRIAAAHQYTSRDKVMTKRWVKG